MTFTSETVRILFHKLPAALQSQYVDMEERLSLKQQRLHIEAVMQLERVSEVIIRISADYKLDAAPGYSGAV